MHSFTGVAAASLALAAVASRGAGEEPVKAAARPSLERLEARLDRAVDSVSLPHAARLMGRAESARAYRLPGYGVVLVLTPRALPGASGRVYFLERGSKPRAVRGEARAPAVEPETFVWTDDEEGLETFERQVLVLQHETEAARREAEEEMARIVRDVRVRVAPPARPVAASAPAPDTPESPAAPKAPAAVPPPAAPEAATAPLPPGVPPAPPPWKFWFETGSPSETRTPDAVVADVRASVIEALAAPLEPVPGLAGDERVTVTVDFVAGGLYAANPRPGRTLVVSVKAKDVAARARGSIGIDELKRRVEVSEY